MSAWSGLRYQDRRPPFVSPLASLTVFGGTGSASRGLSRRLGSGLKSMPILDQLRPGQASAAAAIAPENEALG
jgi:hypothetical protein